MVKFGYYGETKDIKMLLQPLLNLLDGRNDKPYPKGRGKELAFDSYQLHCRKYE